MIKPTGTKPRIHLNKRGTWCVKMPSKDLWHLLEHALRHARHLNARREWSHVRKQFTETR